MVKTSKIAVVVIAVILAFGAVYYGDSFSTSSGRETITMFFSYGTPQSYAPPMIEPTSFTVIEGHTVLVVFRNNDDTQHEIVFPAFGLTTGIVSGHATERIYFTPTKTGTFQFYEPASQCGDPQDPSLCRNVLFLNGTVTVLPP